MIQTRLVPSRKFLKAPEIPFVAPVNLYPAAELVKADRVSFKRKLQRLPEANPSVFPVNRYPAAGGPVAIHRTEFNRKLQRPPVHNEYPEPVLPAAAGFPGWELHFEKTKRTAFRRVDLPENNTYPVTAISTAPPPSFETRQVKPRRKTRFRRLDVEINEYEFRDLPTDLAGGPQIPFKTRKVRSRKRLEFPFTNIVAATPTTPAAYPGFLRPESNKFSFEIHRQEILEGATYEPEVSAKETLVAAFIRAPQTPRIRFKVKRQRIVLDEFAAPPGGTDAPVAAFTSATKAIRRSLPRPDITVSGVILATGSFAPWPSYSNPKVLKRSDTRREQRPVLLGEYTATPAVAEQPVSAFITRPVKRVRSGFVERKVPELDEFTVTPPPPQPVVAALIAAPQVRRTTFKRTLRLAVLEIEAISLPVEVGFAGRAAINNDVTYLKGQMSSTVYNSGTITDAAYLLTWIGNQTKYLKGDMSNVVYLKTDFNLI